MYLLAITIGFFSYTIFFLGILNILYRLPIVLCTILFLFICLFIFLKAKVRFAFTFTRKELLLLLLIILQGLVNLIGVLGPELSFDALWYHLTLPKIFLENHSIFHIPGGVFYYSDMPKSIEMLYIVALAVGNEIIAKVIHFIFGILSLLVLFRLSRKYLSKVNSLLVLLIFYSNLVVGWESITAYIDLGRTFFEISSLLVFVEWFENKSKKYILLLGVLIGLIISTKLIGVSSLVLFLLLFLWIGHKKKTNYTKEMIFITLASFLVASPWLIFSFINTGNPIYPLFTEYYPIKSSLLHLLNPLNFVIELIRLLLFSSDPINPLYLISLPLVVGIWKKINNHSRIIIVYTFLAILAWYFTPRTGGGRFILPYLPAMSLTVGIILEKVKNIYIKRYIVGLIIALMLISIIYRAIANTKYLPVVFGKETKQSFLLRNLNYNFGDYYDIDGKIEKIIKKNDKALVIGGHNLFYVNFPFVHHSYISKGEEFNYIMTIDATLPKRFEKWELVYRNDITKVSLYSDKRKVWKY